MCDLFLFRTIRHVLTDRNCHCRHMQFSAFSNSLLDEPVQHGFAKLFSIQSVQPIARNPSKVQVLCLL
ncbi:hypothetical protein C8246_00310 [Paracidovorax avenae]|nr:hypothetical protein C8246_00310 [Paracidovorax avenae]